MKIAIKVRRFLKKNPFMYKVKIPHCGKWAGCFIKGILRMSDYILYKS